MVLKYGVKIKYKCHPTKSSMVLSNSIKLCPSLNELIREARYSPASSGGNPTVGIVGPYSMRVSM